MIFPDAGRVLYERNPLDTVICQLRFPQILRIEAEEPVAFQERIRSEYPILAVRSQLDLMGLLPEPVAKAVGESLPGLGRSQGRVYDFTSSDEKWKATLAGNFIALTAVKSYRRWEEFRTRLTVLVNALNEIYEPAFLARIGLRYQNVIARSALELDGVAWRELLQPHVAGELASSVPEATIEAITKAVQFRLDDAGKVVVRHSLGRVEPSQEVVYGLDADLFTEERTEVSRGIERLEDFNQEARRLFHWSITERLHRAMGPRPI